MFGLGGNEFLGLLVLGVLLVGAPVGVGLLALPLVRRHGGERVAELVAENRRLRARLYEKNSRA